VANQPVHIEQRVAEAGSAFDLAKGIGQLIEQTDEATALAALLMVGFVLAKRGYPMVDANLKPFIQDVSTYMSTYEVPITRIEQLADVGASTPAIPEVPVVVN